MEKNKELIFSESEYKKLQAERVSTLYEKSHYSILILLVVKIVLLYALKDMFLNNEFYVYLSLLVLTTVFRVINTLLFLKLHKLKRIKKYLKWEKQFALMAHVSALVISSMIYFHYPVDNLERELLLMIIVTGIIAGTSIAYASSFITTIPYILILTIPAEFQLIRGGSTIHIVLSVLLPFFVIHSFLNTAKTSRYIIMGIRFLIEKEYFLSKLQEANSKLEEVNKELEAYDHAVAHDLKNPINSINNYVDILLSNEVEGRSKVDVLKKVRVAGDKAMGIIEGMLDLALHGGKDKQERLNLVDVLKDCQVQLATLIAKKDALINIDLKDKYIFAGKVSITQIITNIISNSIKYADPNRRPNVNVSSEKRGDKVFITIADNGIGMNKDSVKSIFETGKRVHDNSVIEEGHGIGLSTVKRLVENNHGEIQVDSTKGIGTTVTLILSDDIIGKKKNSEGPESLKALPNAKVLFIDDGEDILDIVSLYLKKLETPVDLALTADKAMELIRHNSYDLIYVDMDLGEVSGLDLIKQITDLNILCKTTKIIAFTASTDSELKDNLAKFGVFNYLNKPFNKDDLLSSIINEFH